MIYLIVAILAVGAGLFLAFSKRRGTHAHLGSRQSDAARNLANYADRIRACADRIGQPHANIFWDMVEQIETIRAEIQDSERDLAQARRFIGHHARIIVDLVERFTELKAKARPEQEARLAQMAEQVHGYRDVFARVATALIENDFADIEATMDALDTQLARLDL